MAHNQDTTNTDITPNNNTRVVIMPPNVSSMLQPLDEPVFHPISLSALGSISSQSLPDLVDVHTDSYVWTHSGYFGTSSSDEEAQSLPDLVDVQSDTDSDDSSSSEEENTQGVLILDGYNFDPYILNLDEVMAPQLNRNRPTLRVVPRARPPTNDFNKADIP